MVLVGVASGEEACVVADFAAVRPEEVCAGMIRTLELPLAQLRQMALLVSDQVVESFEGPVTGGADERLGVFVVDGLVGGQVGEEVVADRAFSFLSRLVGRLCSRKRRRGAGRGDRVCAVVDVMV